MRKSSSSYASFNVLAKCRKTCGSKICSLTHTHIYMQAYRYTYICMISLTWTVKMLQYCVRVKCTIRPKGWDYTGQLICCYLNCLNGGCLTLIPSSNHFYKCNKCFLLFCCGLAAVLSMAIPISLRTIDGYPIVPSVTFRKVSMLRLQFDCTQIDYWFVTNAVNCHTIIHISITHAYLRPIYQLTCDS